jgi:hypothetical protein
VENPKPVKDFVGAESIPGNERHKRSSKCTRSTVPGARALWETQTRSGRTSDKLRAAHAHRKRSLRLPVGDHIGVVEQRYFIHIAHSRFVLQSLHDSPDLFGCLLGYVKEANELLYRHPAQITKTMIPSTQKGSQDYGSETEVMRGQRRRVVEPDVHPCWPTSTSRTRAFVAANYLSRHKANLVGLLDHGK